MQSGREDSENADKWAMPKTIHANTRCGTEQGKAELISGMLEHIFDEESKNAGPAGAQYRDSRKVDNIPD